jgi:hypothetical protein
MDIDVFFPASQSRDGFSRPPLPPGGSSRLDPGATAADAQAAAAAAVVVCGTRSMDGSLQGLPRAQQQQQQQVLLPTPSAAAAAPSEPWDLEGLLAPPWDWSCKARLKLASPAPLALLQEAAAGGMQHGEGPWAALVLLAKAGCVLKQLGVMFGACLLSLNRYLCSTSCCCCPALAMK